MSNEVLVLYLVVGLTVITLVLLVLQGVTLGIVLGMRRREQDRGSAPPKPPPAKGRTLLTARFTAAGVRESDPEPEPPSRPARLPAPPMLRAR